MDDINTERTTLEEIIINYPMYKEFDFKIIQNEQKLEVDTKGRMFFDALFNTKKCDLLCVECKKCYPFDVLNKICVFNEDGTPIYNNDSYRIGSFDNSLQIVGITFGDLPSSYVTNFYEKEGIIEQYLYCNKFPHKHIYVVYYRFKISKSNISIMKIGQDVPSFMLSESLSNIYKKELDCYKAFDDFRMYEQSLSRGLKAGACTYLRRVLEKIVIKKYIEKNGQNNNKRFEEKIKDVIDDFDDDIRDILKNTYGLLSKGIHELDENDIDNFINSTFEVITIQLDHEKMIREKKERRKKLMSSINVNVAKYSN